MSSFSQQLTAMGLRSLDFNQAENASLDVLLSQLETEFSSLQQQRPNSKGDDLLLGLMTKTHLSALEQYQSTESQSHAMNDLFVQQLGKEHAARFDNQHHGHFLLVTRLWMLVLGYQQIDLSYAADHAQSSASLLFPDDATGPSHSRAEQTRRRFMQAYYQGKASARDNARGTEQNTSSVSFINSLRGWFQRIFHR
ncbi:hypothetical protein L6J37_11740 [Photobacterium sp. WH77]|uniref:hypothetical protein n=1 Tax=unclassified Photobacterium TaxID=2628852 RepID=UPI001C4856C0|nr:MULTISPECIES: hypothetical protein [unclassified Photobacterium]MBV7264171.1 hypothetical protein [Photobacterium sp. WH24]MCG2837501.1 hypothetical protein [Photobacterium sp. WH77]MCG2845117.1 hypothetical protein [Photobacterium sp. WH80]